MRKGVSRGGLKGFCVSRKGFKEVSQGGCQGGFSRGCLKKVSQGCVVSTGYLKGVVSQVVLKGGLKWGSQEEIPWGDLNESPP